MNFKRSIRILIIVIPSAILVGGFVTWRYTGKQYFLNLLNEELDSKVRQGAHVDNISLNLWSTFPSIGLHAQNLLAKDLIHLTDTVFYLEHLYISVSIKQLISGNLQPKSLILENGFIHLEKDTLATTDPQTKTSRAFTNLSHLPERVLLKNLSFKYQDHTKGKIIHLESEKATIKLKAQEDTLKLYLQGNLLSKQLQFNPAKGGFLQNCPIQGSWLITLLPNLSGIHLQSEKVKLGLNKTPATVLLSLDSLQTVHLTGGIDDISYTNALDWLNPYLREKLSKFNAHQLKDVAFEIVVPKGNVQPAVRINWQLAMDEKVSIQRHVLERVSVTAQFTNQHLSYKLPSDANAMISLNNLKATWKGIDFVAPQVNISRLDTISISGTLKSHSSLAHAASFVKSGTLQPIAGHLEIDLEFKTTLIGNNNVLDHIDGKVMIEHASLLYKPKQLSINQINGEVLFKKTDLSAKNIRCVIEGNRFRANMEAKHLLNFLNSDPESAQMKLDVYCHDLDLNSILHTLGTTTKVNPLVEYGDLPVMKKIDKVLQQGNMRLKITAGSLTLRNFTAKNVKADIQTSPGRWQLNRMSLDHGIGKINLTGSIAGSNKEVNDLYLHAEMSNLDVQKLFHDFENFGQSVINHEQLKGNLRSTVRLTGKINSSLIPIRQSLQGSLIVRLKDGQLVGFVPVMDLQNFFMKNRDFKNVSFSELSDTIFIEQGNMNFSNLVIHSNLLKMEMNGFYGFSGETDLYLRIPISNLSKIHPDALSKIADTAQIEGTSIYLHAKSDDQGKVKFKYDPMKRLRDKRAARKEKNR